MTWLVGLFERKRRVLVELENRLSGESRARAGADHHSKRRPRPCGMTIHTGVGCSYVCTYCYIYDMGFSAIPKPYPLKPDEMAYALSLNPYVIPDRTLAAYGSVTEPFLPETRARAIEYMREVWRWLEMPTQVSTKAAFTDDIVSGILSGDPNTSALVTVVTLSNRRLEPRAPDPKERIRFAGEASARGLAVSLFIRPIIPGITDAEAADILRLAADVGVKSIVLGSLRATERIIGRLEACGVNTMEIRKKLTEPIKGAKQVETKSFDLKAKLSRIADDFGLRVFRSACEANIYSHRRYCAMCHLGPCNIGVSPEPLKSGDIEELLEYLGVSYMSVEVDDSTVRVRLKKHKADEHLRHLITTATYRRVSVETPH